jgi:hypothetical protein
MTGHTLSVRLGEDLWYLDCTCPWSGVAGWGDAKQVWDGHLLDVERRAAAADALYDGRVG